MVYSTSDEQWSDFLGRPALRGEVAKIESTCSGKSILLTGAGGSIGSLLARAIVQAGAQRVILLDKSAQSLQRVREDLYALQGRAECVTISGDICDDNLLNGLFGKYRPELVFHAAALKYVPLLERDPLAAIRTNTLGTFAITEASARYGAAKTIFISTDKAVCPANMLGASKRLGELIFLALNTSSTRMSCVRFGNVLGSQGSVVPLFEEQIQRRAAVTVTHREVTRYFLSGDEAVLLVMAAASLEEGGQVLVPQLGHPIKIAELASYLIRRAGLIPGQDVDIVFTKLRPGDKMAEKLVAPFESKETAIPGLLDRVGTRAVSELNLRRWIAVLQECVESNNVHGLVTNVCEMIPEYQPSPELCELLKLNQASDYPV